MRSTPGAARSTATPVFENSAIVFVESTALTDTTPANEAGYILIRVASLPAAATISTPASRAAVNVGWPSATWSGVSAPPRLMLMTSAPCSRAQSTPSRMSPNETKPESSAILIGIRVESGAMPATPSPLLVSARIVPVTCVPWPTWSLTSAVVPDHVARIDDRDAVEVGVGQVHARVDHRDDHGGVAAGRLPGLGDVDLGEVALLGVVGVGRVAVVRPVEQRQLGVGHDGQDARVGAEGAGEGRGLARLGGHDGPPRALHGRGRGHAGNADRGRGDALPDDDEPALEGLGVRGPAGSHGAGGARRGRDPEHERRREQQRDARPGRHRASPFSLLWLMGVRVTNSVRAGRRTRGV